MPKKQEKPSFVRGNFDGITNKFDANIYGTLKGQLRHALLIHYLRNFIEEGLPNVEQLSVLDIGGGTGMMALEFAKHQHNVVVRDVSEEALQQAKKRIQGFENVSYEHGGIDDIKETYDFIVCHALLEWLNQPLSALQTIIGKLNKGGVLSLSFFNHDAKVFNNLLYGNFDYVSANMPSKNTVRLNPHNAQKPKAVIEFLEGLGDASIIATRGIRCIHDYMIDKTRIEPQIDHLFELEIEYGNREPFKYLGKYFHILIKKE